MTKKRKIITQSPNGNLTFSILINSSKISEEHQVKSISVEKEVNQIPFAHIVLFDGDTATQDFSLSNEDAFIPGNDIEIKTGYNSEEETIFKGIIIKHSIKIRENSSVLVVECRDKAVKATIGRKSAYYYESNDSDILTEIAQNHGLTAQVETTNNVHKELVQYQASDWDFMMTRAQANGKVCIVEEGKLTIEKPNLSKNTIQTIAFGANLLSFDAEMDARSQMNTISSYGWNPSDQKIIETNAKALSLNLNGNISPSELADVLEIKNFDLKHGGIDTITVLQDWSDAKALFQQLAKTRGRVKFQGASNVKPGTLIKLEGVGDRFNGTVFISAIKHEIAKGNWTTDATFGLNPTWFSETYDINDSQAAGLVPAINGLQIGIVSKLENDPDGEDRILVQIPIINNEEQGIWARIASLDAGENRGAFFRPEIGDEVIIGFVNDDPNHAVILGMLNSSAKPAPITTKDENNEKGFITRSDMKLIFNDEKKSISIETPGGKKITIDEDAGSIEIQDENSNIITLDNNGILAESGSDFVVKAKGDVTIEGTNISLNANAEFKAEGSSGAEVSTSATAVLKGSLVQIN